MCPKSKKSSKIQGHHDNWWPWTMYRASGHFEHCSYLLYFMVSNAITCVCGIQASLVLFFSIAVFRSIIVSSQESGEKAETMTGRDAAMFPIIASCTLFGIYIFFKVTTSIS